MHKTKNMTRRTVLVTLASAATLGTGALGIARAQSQAEAAILAFTGGRQMKTGKVKLDIAPLVENGNSVSVGVDVDHPMTETAHVRRIGIFNEKNPQPEVAVFHLGPRSGSAKVFTRIRLATTQHLTAVAELSDGSLWSEQIEVIVTIAACMEE